VSDRKKTLDAQGFRAILKDQKMDSHNYMLCETQLDDHYLELPPQVRQGKQGQVHFPNR